MSVEVRTRRHGVDVELSLDFAAGPVVVLFGPSGAGKTTVLRTLAGLDGADDGYVRVDGQTWARPGRLLVPAHRRRVGYLFQDHALFPHLDASANVAFGVRARGATGRRRRGEAVQQALAAAGAAHLAGRAVGGLSGGEAQRVALARALAREPRLLLLDEPLSALDAPVRRELGQDLRELLVARGVPTLLVTHDRTEALRLGDTAVVVDAGGVLQVGGVAEVFDRPAGPRAAAVVGVETALAGRLLGRGSGVAQVQVGEHRWWAVDPGVGLPASSAGSGADGSGADGSGAERSGAGHDVLVCIRAEDVAIALPGASATTVSTRNQVPAVVTALADEGPLVRVDLDARGAHLVALVTRPARQDLALSPGAAVVALVRATAVHLVPRV